MDILGTKDPSLRTLVSELVRRLPPNTFVVVDNWGADPFAIGLARPSDHQHLVYICSDRDVDGRYFIARELPARHDLEPFRSTGVEQVDDVDAIAQVVATHLGAA